MIYVAGIANMISESDQIQQHLNILMSCQIEVLDRLGSKPWLLNLSVKYTVQTQTIRYQRAITSCLTKFQVYTLAVPLGNCCV